MRGLKENIIIGHPIPAGTGMKRYRDVKLFDEDNKDLDIEMQEILDRRKLEKVTGSEDDDLLVEETEAEED